MAHITFDLGFEGATGAGGRGDLGIEKGWSHCLMCVAEYLEIIGCIPLHGVWCDLSGGEGNKCPLEESFSIVL